MWLYNYVCCFIIITIVTTNNIIMCSGAGNHTSLQLFVLQQNVAARLTFCYLSLCLPWSKAVRKFLSVSSHFPLIQPSTPYNMLQLHLIIKWFIKILIAPSFLWLNYLRVSVKSQTILITYCVCVHVIFSTALSNHISEASVDFWLVCCLSSGESRVPVSHRQCRPEIISWVGLSGKLMVVTSL